MHNRIILVWFLEYWYIICWWPITKYPKNFPHLVVPNPPQRGATRSFEKLKTPAANPYRGPLIWPPCVPWFSIIMEVWPLCCNIKRYTYPTRIAGQGIILLEFLRFCFFSICQHERPEVRLCSLLCSQNLPCIQMYSKWKYK